MIVKATLVKQVTDDGFIQTGLPVGEELFVDSESVKQGFIYNRPHGKYFLTSIINAVTEEGKFIGWFPLELLDMQEDIESYDI